jgi:hypothetical protein
VLLDHPAVVGVLNEILSHQGLASEECYGFRFDHTYTSHRTAGHDNWRPHGGSGFFNFPGSSHMYHMQQGKVHAGLTRVVWELNEVKPGDGATKFLSGSHKAVRNLHAHRTCTQKITKSMQYSRLYTAMGLIWIWWVPCMAVVLRPSHAHHRRTCATAISGKTTGEYPHRHPHVFPPLPAETNPDRTRRVRIEFPDRVLGA